MGFRNLEKQIKKINQFSYYAEFTVN